METALAAAHLAMSGVLERHADLTICLAHAGGRVEFGSDWPFSMGLPEPHKQLADVDVSLPRRIFQDNFKVLGLQ